MFMRHMNSRIANLKKNVWIESSQLHFTVYLDLKFSLNQSNVLDAKCRNCRKIKHTSASCSKLRSISVVSFKRNDLFSSRFYLFLLRFSIAAVLPRLVQNTVLVTALHSTWSCGIHRSGLFRSMPSGERKKN